MSCYCTLWFATSYKYLQLNKKCAVFLGMLIGSLFRKFAAVNLQFTRTFTVTLTMAANAPAVDEKGAYKRKDSSFRDWIKGKNIIIINIFLSCFPTGTPLTMTCSSLCTMMVVMV